MAQHQLPNADVIKSMNVNELMHATLRLSDIMAEESALLDTRRYGEIAKLQEEKLRLTTLLENYQRVLSTDATLVRNADPSMREELLLLTDDLAFGVEENFRKVSAARAVNMRIMQAIMDVMSEEQRPAIYSKDGTTNAADNLALSMNLNQKA